MQRERQVVIKSKVSPTKSTNNPYKFTGGPFVQPISPEIIRDPVYKMHKCMDYPNNNANAVKLNKCEMKVQNKIEHETSLPSAIPAIPTPKMTKIVSNITALKKNFLL